MGSPLAHVLANIFITFYESKCLNEYKFKKTNFYLKHFNDTLAAFEKEQVSLDFLNFFK